MSLAEQIQRVDGSQNDILKKLLETYGVSTSGKIDVIAAAAKNFNLTGTDYSTNRPRGIVLQTSEPSSVPNGCLVGVYE